MAVKKKRTARKTSFLSKVQKSSKVRKVRAKIKSKKAELKKLSREYKATLKSESRRLAR
ncbi:MAG: hypothetical protein IPM51_12120 [Sphingobacteriaceae bacterium]|nr:hypothetical protein [Sphingobacteriaceae bacterium]